MVTVHLMKLKGEFVQFRKFIQCSYGALPRDRLSVFPCFCSHLYSPSLFTLFFKSICCHSDSHAHSTTSLITSHPTHQLIVEQHITGSPCQSLLDPYSVKTLNYLIIVLLFIIVFSPVIKDNNKLNRGETYL